MANFSKVFTFSQLLDHVVKELIERARGILVLLCWPLVSHLKRLSRHLLFFSSNVRFWEWIETKTILVLTRSSLFDLNKNINFCYRK